MLINIEGTERLKLKPKTDDDGGTLRNYSDEMKIHTAKDTINEKNALD